MVTEPIIGENEKLFLCSHCGLKESRSDQSQHICNDCGEAMFPAESFQRTASTSGTFYSGTDRVWFGQAVSAASVIFGFASLFFSLFGFWYPVLNLPLAFVGVVAGISGLLLNWVDGRTISKQAGENKEQTAEEKSYFNHLKWNLKIAKWGLFLSLGVFFYWIAVIVYRLNS